MYVNHLIQYRKLFFISISLKSIEIDIFIPTNNTASIYQGGDWDLEYVYSHTPRVVGVFFVRPKHQETVNANSCVLQNIQQQTARMHVFIPTKRWNARWRHKNQMASWWQLKHFLFSPLFGEDFHFDSYFSNGLKPPTRCCVYWFCCVGMVSWSGFESHGILYSGQILGPLRHLKPFWKQITTLIGS